MRRWKRFLWQAAFVFVVAVVASIAGADAAGYVLLALAGVLLFAGLVGSGGRHQRRLNPRRHPAPGKVCRVTPGSGEAVELAVFRSGRSGS